MLLAVRDADHVHARCSSSVCSAVAAVATLKISSQRSVHTFEEQEKASRGVSERNHSPTEDRAVACPGRGVARPISIKRQTLSCLPLLDPQVGGRENIKPPCPVRSNDLLQAREAFMLPSMLKGYRQLLPRPLGTTRDHSQHS